jgi:N-dimethylarginine dimethylaminohydrolase
MDDPRALDMRFARSAGLAAWEPAARRVEPGTPATRILMCAPDFFGVDYVINPWMEGQIGKAARTLAQAQWTNLRRGLEREAAIEFVAPARGLPDMVFTANAGLAIGDKAVVSRFKAPERRPEEQLFRACFDALGYRLAPWPEDVAFEGAGDALVDCARPLIWCGHGFRSSPNAAKRLEEIFDRETVSLRLVDPRFYHLDTCFCPLPDGWLLYYAGAFDEASQDAIARLTPREKRIEASEADAIAFACNAIEINRRVFMNGASQALQTRLRDAEFQPVVSPLGEFIKAGGGAKCLTLNLSAT